MSSIHSNDPRAVRTRQGFQDAFFALLQEKPYSQITVTDVANRAGFARHTFYNHYDALDDLLSNLIDSVMEAFFTKLERWDFELNDKAAELRMVAAFFQVWKDRPEVVQILNKLDVDDLLIKRLNAYFTEFYYDQVTPKIPGASLTLAHYMISFNAYTLLGILKPWLQDEMQYPPEVMAKFLVQLTGSTQRRHAVEEFKRVIR
ncbi:MAG: TetR/AcrR family transcriptional regulator [Chloroflexota bacterium]